MFKALEQRIASLNLDPATAVKANTIINNVYKAALDNARQTVLTVIHMIKKIFNGTQAEIVTLYKETAKTGDNKQFLIDATHAVENSSASFAKVAAVVDSHIIKILPPLEAQVSFAAQPIEDLLNVMTKPADSLLGDLGL